MNGPSGADIKSEPGGSFYVLKYEIALQYRIKGRGCADCFNTGARERAFQDRRGDLTHVYSDIAFDITDPALTDEQMFDIINTRITASAGQYFRECRSGRLLSAAVLSGTALL